MWPSRALIQLYKSLIQVMEYADVVWDGCSATECDLLESLQIEATRVVTGAMKGINRESLLVDIAWPTLKYRRNVHKLCMMYRLRNNLAPQYLRKLCPELTSSRTNYKLWSSSNLSLPLVRTERLKKSFIPSSIKLWNDLFPNPISV